MKCCYKEYYEIFLVRINWLSKNEDWKCVEYINKFVIKLFHIFEWFHYSARNENMGFSIPKMKLLETTLQISNGHSNRKPNNLYQHLYTFHCTMQMFTYLWPSPNHT